MFTQNRTLIVLAIVGFATVALTFGVPANAATITEDFEGATAPAVPSGWTTIGASGSGSYATTSGTGNPSQSGNLDWSGSITTAPSVYLVNSGVAFDATQAISGSFDFYNVEDGNYTRSNFILGDVQSGLTGSSAGKFLNVFLQERTFGARARLYDGTGSILFSGDGNNTYQIENNQWYSASFTWTPTTGTTGDFLFSWDGAQGAKGPMSAIGYTFDSAEVYFGFGTGRSPVRFDNLSITGTEFSSALIGPYWDGPASGGTGDGTSDGGTGTWSTTNANWDRGTGPRMAWDNGAGDTATFGGSGGTVTLGEDINLAGMTIGDGLNYTFDSNTLNFAAGSSIDTGAGTTATINSAIAGSGDLTKTGPGTLTLSGANTYSGGTTISEGGIILGNKNGFGTGSVTLAGGVNFKTQGFEGNSASGALPNDFILSGGLVNVDVSFGGAKDIWINTAVSGSGGFNVSGSGRTQGLTLSGAKTFTGGVIVGSGSTVSIDNNASLGTGTLRSENGTLRITENVNNVANPVVIGSGQNFKVKVLNGKSATLSGIISDEGAGGSLTKTEPGTLVLTGANTYTGLTDIQQGTLKLQGAAFSTTARDYSIASGAVLNLDGHSIVAPGISTISGGGELRLSGGLFEATSNGRDITMNLDSGALINIQSGATLRNGGWQNITWTGNKADMTVDGTLDLWDGQQVRVDALNGNGTITHTSYGGLQTLVIGVDNGGGNFGGTITETGGHAVALHKVGTGSQAISGNNSYTGSTTVTGGGYLQINSDSALGAVPGSPTVNLTLDNGGIKNNNSTNVLHTNRTVYLGAGGGWFTTGWGKNTTINGQITGPGSLTINNDSGWVIPTNTANDYTGNTIVGARLSGASGNNANMRLGASEVIPHGVGYGDVVINSGNTNGTLDLNGFDETINGLFGDGRVYSSTGSPTLTVGADNQAATFTGTINSGMNLTKIGTGTQTLQDTLIDHTGETTVNAGTLRFLELDDLHNSTLTIASGASAVFENSSRMFNRFSATSIEGDGTFVKTGSNVLRTGNATNQFAHWNMSGGLIDIQEGEFRVSYQDNNPATGAWSGNLASMNIEAGALVQLEGGNYIAVDALTGAGTIQNRANWGVGPLTVGTNNHANSPGNTATFSGAIRDDVGVVALYKVGTGTQVLQGNLIDYTGATTVNGGRLILSNNDDTHTSSMNIAAGAVLEQYKSSGEMHNLGVTSFTGAGTYEKTGAGLVDLSWDRPAVNIDFSSGAMIDVSEGTLRLGYGMRTNWTNNKADLNVDAGATFNLWDSGLGNGGVIVDALTGAGTVTKTTYGAVGQLTVGIDNGSGTFSGTITNQSGQNLHLVKEGTGTQVLTGTNTYSGTTTVNNGTLQIGAGGAGSIVSQTTVNSGGTLAGTGLVSNSVSVNGTVSPGDNGGDAIGTLTVDSATFNAGSTLAIQLDPANPGNFTPTGWGGIATAAASDTLDVTGDLTLGGTLDLRAVSDSWARGQEFNILDFVLSATNDADGDGEIDSHFEEYIIPYLYSDDYAILTHDDLVSGQFLPDLGETGEGLGGSLTWDFTDLYSQGIIRIVPEPSTWAIFGLGLFALGLFRRRRR